MHHPEDRKYTKDHEWIAVADGVGTVGITHHAQDQLGDVVFVELPTVGADVQAGATFSEVESTKSVSDIFAPVAGKVVEINEDLVENPELVNEDPYGEGWICVIEVTDLGQVDSLLDADAYKSLIEA